MGESLALYNDKSKGAQGSEVNRCVRPLNPWRENSRSESCESPTWSKENDALAAENQKMKGVL